MHDNWRDIVWEKVEYLTQLGLEPWYLEIQDILAEAAIVEQNNTLYDDVEANPPRAAFVFPRKCTSHGPVCTQIKWLLTCSCDSVDVICLM